MQTKRKPDDKLAFWRQKVEQHRSSGLSRREFCQRNGINKSSLDYWFTRIRKAEKNSPEWVELKGVAAPSLGSPLAVLVAGRYCIQIRSGFDPHLFAKVVKALESLA